MCKRNTEIIKETSGRYFTEEKFIRIIEEYAYNLGIKIISEPEEIGK
jgi:hypothetical protein